MIKKTPLHHALDCLTFKEQGIMAERIIVVMNATIDGIKRNRHEWTNDYVTQEEYLALSKKVLNHLADF